MDWISFHHPDWSLPVVRRRAQEEWLDLMKDLAEILATGGRAEFWKYTYPNLRAYHNAMSRLRKAGLLVKHDVPGKLPHLTLTPRALISLPPIHVPGRHWNSKWNGIWYMLIFDVPEKERHYRDTLRNFLKRMRMGCLQKSVWITPRDIRPEYDDLDRAANIDAIAYLLESRTVLHQDETEMVENAWNFAWINKLQERYLAVFSENLLFLNATDHDRTALMNLLNQEAEAYIQCMRPDPLLPNKLLPKNYRGKKVYELHQTLRQAVGRQLLKHIA